MKNTVVSRRYIKPCAREIWINCDRLVNHRTSFGKATCLWSLQSVCMQEVIRYFDGELYMTYHWCLSNGCISRYHGTYPPGQVHPERNTVFFKTILLLATHVHTCGGACQHMWLVSSDFVFKFKWMFLECFAAVHLKFCNKIEYFSGWPNRCCG